MTHNNAILAPLLASLDLGVSVAELDNLLNSARVETSAYSDLINGRVDLAAVAREPRQFFKTGAAFARRGFA